MKKVLILGGAGMLGHKAFQILSTSCDTYATFRNIGEIADKSRIFDKGKIFDNVDARDFETVRRALDTVRPDFVINCVGIIKQKMQSRNERDSIYVNSLFPHLLAEYCDQASSKLIQISTDCVFSGRKGNYVESDASDADDIYGKTKYLGEVRDGKSLTLRTSIIGHSICSQVSLVDWFLAQESGSVKGYAKAFFSGLPTVTFCHELLRIVEQHPDLSGVFNVSSQRISKLELLTAIKQVYGLSMQIERDESFHCDRTLNSGRYRAATNFNPPDWHEMIVQMYNDRILHNIYGKRT